MGGIHGNYYLQTIWGQNISVSTICSLWAELSKIGSCNFNRSIVFIKHQSHLLCSQRVTGYGLKWLRHDSFNIREKCLKRKMILNMVCGHHSSFKLVIFWDKKGRFSRIPLFIFWLQSDLECKILQWKSMINWHNPREIFLFLSPSFPSLIWLFLQSQV